MTQIKRKRRTILFRKAQSLSTNQTSLADINMSMEQPSFIQKYLNDDFQDMNLTKLIYTPQKLTTDRLRFTQNQKACHITQADNINKRFQRCPDNNDPFLKAKLKHIMKKSQSRLEPVKTDYMLQRDETCREFNNNKLTTLRQIKEQQKQKLKQMLPQYKNIRRNLPRELNTT